MSRVLETLEPKAVFHFFEDLTRIPHGSRNTKAISDYCVAFAKERGLWVYQDALNNVIIKKPATAGCEAAPAVILQGHLDMVAEKTPESPIDFTKDALDLRVEGDYVSANGTTFVLVFNQIIHERHAARRRRRHCRRHSAGRAGQQRNCAPGA